MSRNKAEKRLRQMVSGTMEVDSYVDGIASILHDAMSNGREVIPFDYGTVEEQKYMAMMIKMGLLQPVHLFHPISLRYVVQEEGIRLYRKLSRDGYYRRTERKPR